MKQIKAFLIAILMLSLGIPSGAMEKSTALGQQLIEAAHDGELEKVERLIKDGASVNEKNNRELTALMKAARQGHKSCCEMLLKYGASVNEKNYSGFTASMHAATYGHLSCLEALLKSGASANEKDYYGGTTLMCAAEDGHQSCCEILLKYGATVSEKNKHGETALMFAARGSYQSCCETLVEVMLGMRSLHAAEAYATLFCMKEIQPRPDDKIFGDIIEPVTQRLCFAQKMSKKEVLAEVNKITHPDIKQSLIKKYFSESTK